MSSHKEGTDGRIESRRRNGNTAPLLSGRRKRPRMRRQRRRLWFWRQWQRRCRQGKANPSTRYRERKKKRILPLRFSSSSFSEAMPRASLRPLTLNEGARSPRRSRACRPTHELLSPFLRELKTSKIGSVPLEATSRAPPAAELLPPSGEDCKCSRSSPFPWESDLNVKVNGI